MNTIVDVSRDKWHLSEIKTKETSHRPVQDYDICVWRVLAQIRDGRVSYGALTTALKTIISVCNPLDRPDSRTRAGKNNYN